MFIFVQVSGYLLLLPEDWTSVCFSAKAKTFNRIRWGKHQKCKNILPSALLNTLCANLSGTLYAILTRTRNFKCTITTLNHREQAHCTFIIKTLTICAQCCLYSQWICKHLSHEIINIFFFCVAIDFRDLNCMQCHAYRPFIWISSVHLKKNHFYKIT